MTVLLEKIAGAHAEAGGSLAEVAATATKVNDQGRSMGLALTSCVVPAAGTPTFDLPDDEVEVGIGIHGEPGRRREKLAPVDEMAEVARGADRVGPRPVARRHGPRVRQRHGRHAAHRAVRGVQQRGRILGGQGISIGRSLVGNYITSLEMAGFSVTLLRLDDELTRLVGRAGPHAGPALGRLSPLPPLVRAAAPVSLGRRPPPRLDSRASESRCDP